MIYEVITQWTGEAPINQLCRVLDVGRSGYAYDLALVSLLERVTAPDRGPVENMVLAVYDIEAARARERAAQRYGTAAA